MIKELTIGDVESVSFVADRAHIEGAEESALLADGGTPGYWSAGVKAFRASPGKQFLLMRASSPDDRVHIYLCRDRVAFVKAFAAAAGVVPEGTPVLWVCNGNEETHGLLSKLLGKELTATMPQPPMLPDPNPGVFN